MSLLKQIVSFFGAKDETLIVPYIGYASDKKIFLKGRVLKNKGISTNPSNSKLRNLINTYKRFETDEIGCIDINVLVNGQQFDLTTDEEGYFWIDGEWDAPPLDQSGIWLKTQFNITNKDRGNKDGVTAIGEIHYSTGNFEYGIISDIDDTVLLSHVTSRLKWKMLYLTLFKDAFGRKPVLGIVRFLTTLVKGSDGQQSNPIFYVSHSPWNLYDSIIQFLDIQNLPKGPVLLRDYGLRPSGAFGDHKEETIRHILTTYPNKQFILLGDSGEKDADYYLQIAQEFPNRIKAIYIRKIRDGRNASRINELIAQHADVDILLSDTSEKFIKHAREIGLIA